VNDLLMHCEEVTTIWNGLRRKLSHQLWRRHHGGSGVTIYLYNGVENLNCLVASNISAMGSGLIAGQLAPYSLFLF
jgi:hypothetical protein